MMTSVMSLHDIDDSEFLKVLDSCESNVFLVTPEGDKINLRSKLSQLLGLTKLSETAEANADVDLNKKVDSTDSLYILKCALDILKLPVKK